MFTFIYLADVFHTKNNWYWRIYTKLGCCMRKFHVLSPQKQWRRCLGVRWWPSKKVSRFICSTHTTVTL